MTKKQRFLAAVRREVPDAVPVSPLIHHRFAHRLLGRRDWKAAFEVHQMIRSTHFRGPLGVSVEAVLPEGWGEERRAIETCPDGRIVAEIVIRTPMRTMVGKHVAGMIPDDPLVGKTVEYPIKSPEDWRAWIAFQEQWLAGVKGPRFETLLEAIEVMGEEGVPSVGLPAAWAMAGEARGMQELLMDLHDYPDLIEAALEVGRAVMGKHVEAFLKSPAEIAWLDICWATGANIGPSSFERWALPDVVRAMELVKRAPGKYLGLYTLGRVRKLLPMLVDTGVHFIETFEPNEGDITLAEAKAEYGDRICIMGNFDSMILAFGTVEDARREAIRCLREGMKGGGFVLVTGDEVPANAKLENLRAMVDAVEERGRYV
jgi:uroporphyrinogen-III decarboxylase